MFEIVDFEGNIVTDDDIVENAPKFQFTYLSINDLVRQKHSDDLQSNTTISSSSRPTNIAPSSQRPINSSANARKRRVSPTSGQRPTKRAKQTKQLRSAGPKTPDQQDVLPKPSGSGETDTSGITNKSGDSTESTDEDLTRTFIKTILTEARVCLKSDFRTLPWSKSQVKTQFEYGYSLQIHC